MVNSDDLRSRSCKMVKSLTYFVDDGPDLECLIDGISRSQKKFWLGENENWLEAESIMRQPAKIVQLNADEFLRFFLPLECIFSKMLLNMHMNDFKYPMVGALSISSYLAV